MLMAKKYGSGGIRTHAPEETGALNQRLRPLGHATLLFEHKRSVGQSFISFRRENIASRQSKICDM